MHKWPSFEVNVVGDDVKTSMERAGDAPYDLGAALVLHESCSPFFSLCPFPSLTGKDSCAKLRLV